MNGAMKLIRNARLYAPEDLGCMDVLIGGGKILRIAGITARRRGLSG